MSTSTFAPSPVDTNNGAQNHRALAATHWWSDCEMGVTGVERHAALATLAAAYYQGGAAAVIKAACGGRDGYVKRAWALAMTAVHGPVGMHESQELHPEVIRVKAKAHADLQVYLGV